MLATLPRFDDDSSDLEMADPPASPYSKSAVVAAGRAIATPMEYGEEAIEAFRAAHSWRASCVHPMRRIRHELTWRAKRVQIAGAVTVARLKRMQSIRKKMCETDYTLYQMQDIAGCRAILGSMSEVASLLDVYRSGQGNRPISREFDYVERPKADGYRCNHLVFKFNGEDDDPAYGRHFVEMQLRTVLQHAWATAVEAVGLFQRSDIKGGAGDPKWRRLFLLVSSEFASIEGGALVPGTPEDGVERRKELRDLVHQLDAIKTLDGIRETIKYADTVQSQGTRFYLIQYNYERRRVNITPYFYLPQGLEEYMREERDKVYLNSVLVEVDRIGDLKEAYPNYFLDVGLFTERLREIVSPSHPDRAPSVSRWRPDLSWLKGWRDR